MAPLLYGRRKEQKSFISELENKKETDSDDSFNAKRIIAKK